MFGTTARAVTLRLSSSSSKLALGQLRQSSRVVSNTVTSKHQSSVCSPSDLASSSYSQSSSFYSTEAISTTTTTTATKEESSEKTSTTTPTKEKLLLVDWLLEHQVPGVLKSRIKPLLDACKDDVVLQDDLYNYNVKGKAGLMTHIAKIRMYFRYMSPYNKVEHLGSCVYDGEDVVVLLWRLSTMHSSIWTYFPSFITKKESKIVTSEGALDVHVTPDGQIYKMINRKVTASDREGAKVMAEFKKTAENDRQQAQEKEARRQADEEAWNSREQ